MEEEEVKSICHYCVGEKYLKNEIVKNDNIAFCSYCDEETACFTVAEVADRIEQAFEEHYYRTDTEPDGFEWTLMNDRESDYDWERKGTPVLYAIQKVAEIPKKAAQDIQEILDERNRDPDPSSYQEENEFDLDSHYETKGVNDDYWQGEWKSFEKMLKTEARYFNRKGADHLRRIFQDIDNMETAHQLPLVVAAGPGCDIFQIYRARVFQSDDKLKMALFDPGTHLGPPPSVIAVAGRMNARGISVFYGADDPKAAMAEVRPPVGSQVTVARFQIIRPLQLLDLSALSKTTSTGSVFDENYVVRLSKAMFFRNLSKRLTKPVMPDDESLEYLATQAIADFLATDSDIALDGIIFPSVQVSGKSNNVVLFHKASLVAPLDRPEGTEVDVSLGEWEDEEWRRYYMISESQPTEEIKKIPHIGTHAEIRAMLINELYFSDNDTRTPSIKIDIDSIKIHLIKAVEFTTDEFSVTRFVYKKISAPKRNITDD